MTEIQTSQETLRDISYSEISLNVRDISERTNKSHQVGITIRDYIDTYFKKNKTQSNIWFDYWYIDYRNKVWDRSFIESESWKERLTSAVKKIVKTRIEQESIPIETMNGIEVKNGLIILHYGKWDTLEIDITRQTIEGLIVEKMTQDKIDALEEPLLTHEKVLLLGWTVITISSIIILPGVRTIRRFQIEDIWGVKLTLEWRFEVSAWWKVSEIEILDILKSQGIELNPKSLSFENTWNGDRLSLKKIEARLRWVNYQKLEDFMKALSDLWIDISDLQLISEWEFQEMKWNMLDMFQEIRTKHWASITRESLMREIMRKPKYGKLYLWGGLMILGLDTFSWAFSDHDDLAAYLEEAATIWAFGLGMMAAGPIMNLTWKTATWRFIAGSSIGKKIPTVAWKVVWWLVLWFGAVIGGNTFAHWVLDAKNQFTRRFPEREDWFHKHGFDDDLQSSRLLNKLWGGIMYDAVDWVSHLPKLTGTEDWNVPFVDWRDGMDTFLWNSSIDTATDPIEYMSYTARTVDEWNVRAEVFRQSSLSNIKALLQEHIDEVKWINKHVNERITETDTWIQVYESHIKSAESENDSHKKEYFQEKLARKLSLKASLEETKETLKKEFFLSLTKALWQTEWATLRYVNLRIYDRITSYFASKDYEWYNWLIDGSMSPESFIPYIDWELRKLKIDQKKDTERKGEYVLGFESDMQKEEELIQFALNGNASWVEIWEMYLLTNRWEMSRQMMNYDDLKFIASLNPDERAFLEKIYTRTLNRKRMLDTWVYINRKGEEISQEEAMVPLHNLGYDDGFLPEEALTWVYQPSEDEVIWEYFTGSIDENIDHQKTLDASHGLSIEQKVANMGPKWDKSDSTPPKASQMFFRFYDRIVELKRSQVFIRNIQERGTGRAWQSESISEELRLSPFKAHSSIRH